MVAALGPTYFRSRVLEANPLPGDVDACNRALGKCGRDFEHCILFDFLALLLRVTLLFLQMFVVLVNNMPAGRTGMKNS